MIKYLFGWIINFSILMSVAGCGQTGPLYLPVKNAPTTQQDHS